MKITKENGEVIVETTFVGVKISKNRDIYMKTPKEKEYKITGHKTPMMFSKEGASVGMTLTQKEVYAKKLIQQYLDKHPEIKASQGDESEEGEKSPESSEKDAHKV